MKAEKKQKKKGGRKTLFTQKLADKICERIADGESLRSICEDEDMPSRISVFKWLANDKNKIFREQYAYARAAQAETLIDEMFDIVDDGRNDWIEKLGRNGQSIGWVVNGEAVQRSKLRLEARQWYARKMLPKKYGDKIEIDSSDALLKAIVDVPARMSREEWLKSSK